MYKFLCCNRSYQKRFDQDLKKHFFNTYKFCKRDINKFILLLETNVYPYEYMDDWKKFSEVYCLKKKISTVSQIWKILLMQVTDRQKELEGDFEIKNRINITICVFKAIKYCYLMQIKVFEICVLKYMTLTLLVFFCTRISIVISFLKGIWRIRIINLHRYVINGKKRHQK